MTHQGSTVFDACWELLAQLPGLLVVADQDTNCIYTNDSTANTFGFANAEAMLGVTPYECAYPEIECADLFMQQNAEVMKSKKNLTLFDIHTYANGQTKVLLSKKKPYIRNNEIAGTIWYATELDLNCLSKISVVLAADKKYQAKHKMTQRSYTVGCLPGNKSLTPRELDCLFYLIRGKTAKGIGLALNITTKTVQSYIENMKMKLACSYRAQLIEYGIANGYLNYIPQKVLADSFSEVID